MYHIMGADGKEYGPVNLEQLRQWISEGRVNEQSRLRPEGATDWRKAGEIPEVAALLHPTMPSSPAASSPSTPPPMPSKKLANTSLVLGVLSFLCLGPLTGIPAIICGHIARGRVRRSPGAYQGANQALIGLALGYANLAVMLLVLPAIFLPALAKAKARAQEINCSNHMRQIALAYKIWSLDHDDQFPFNVSTNQGGTLEFAKPNPEGDPNGYRHLMVMSNELSTPKVLVCPADKKTAADSFASLGPENVSYVVMSGTNVVDGNPGELLLRCPIHNHKALVDGSVESGRKPRRPVGSR